MVKIMCYSYVMGIDSTIRELESQGFEIKADECNYRVIFPNELCTVWEAFITKHLEIGYWNDYLMDDKVVFLFRVEDGIRRYEVFDYKNDEVLSLCEQLCECKFESIKQMLVGNSYYKEILSK